MTMNPKEIFDQLRQGNQRFVQGNPQQTFSPQAIYSQVRDKQTPKATVLACSDSRVPIEILFDQYVGDLFVARVAGNIPTPSILDTILFGIENLQTPVLLVLGHENCGAVQAAMNESGFATPLKSLMPYLTPATTHATSVAEAVQHNVENTLHFLNKIPQIQEKIAQETLLLKGGIVDFTSGSISFL